MCADIDITSPAADAARTGSSLRDRLAALDLRVFEFAAGSRWPGAERVLPRLSRAANHGALWFAVGGALAATGSPR
ncbi:phosphoesterase, partial [Streptomyces sp. SID14478]|nr:phosphoesterase [Streptomyces sp. SID14478]